MKPSPAEHTAKQRWVCPLGSIPEEEGDMALTGTEGAGC
jgi:hypothetical protein